MALDTYTLQLRIPWWVKPYVRVLALLARMGVPIDAQAVRDRIVAAIVPTITAVKS